jgi:hypothetical protein
MERAITDTPSPRRDTVPAMSNAGLPYIRAPYF